jgi:hypothetical protein
MTVGIVGAGALALRLMSHTGVTQRLTMAAA